MTHVTNTQDVDVDSKSFFSGTIKLISGSTVSQVIALATAPIITRLFTPYDFGIYGIVMTVGTWITSFACLGYFQAIPLARSKGEMSSIILLSLIITSVLFPVSFLVPLLIGKNIAAWLDAPHAYLYFYFIPLFFLANSLDSMLGSTLARESMFGISAIRNFVTVNISRIFTIIWGVVLGSSAIGLIICNLSGLGISIIIAAIVLWPIISNAGKTKKRINYVAKKHKQFPTVQMWNWLLAATSKSFPVLILGYYFGPVNVGLFVYARSIIFLPRNLLSNSISEVFYPRGASEWLKENKIEKNIWRAVNFLTYTTLLPSIIITFFAPMLFEFAFGYQWRNAGEFAQILSPWMFFGIIAGPISLVMIITERAHWALMYNITMVIVRGGTLIVGGLLGSSYLALLLFSIGSAAVLLVQILMCLNWAKAPIKHIFKFIGKQTVISLLMLSPSIIMYEINVNKWVVFLLMFVGILSYYALLLKINEQFREQIAKLLKLKK